MKKTGILALILLISVTGFSQAKKKSPVDGRIYTLTLTPQGEKKAEAIRDEGSFAANKFKSSFMQQAGFQPTDYDYEVDSISGTAEVKFTVEAKIDDSQERFSWDGTISGDTITGTAIIRKKGKIQHTYAITGTWKNKKKPKPQPKPAPVKTAVPDSAGTGG